MKIYKLVVRPFGANEGKFKVSCEKCPEKVEWADVVVGGWLGDLLQKHLGNKTHMVEIKIKEVKT